MAAQQVFLAQYSFQIEPHGHHLTRADLDVEGVSDREMLSHRRTTQEQGGDKKLPQTEALDAPRQRKDLEIDRQNNLLTPSRSAPNVDSDHARCQE